MLKIERYLNSIEHFLNTIPYKLLSRVEVEDRGGVVFKIKGFVIFKNNSELHFKEYFIKKVNLEKIGYSYHYQNKQKEIIFRYDNAEHHHEIRTFPHHKHIKDKVDEIKKIPAIQNVVDEILKILVK